MALLCSYLQRLSGKFSALTAALLLVSGLASFAISHASLDRLMEVAQRGDLDAELEARDLETTISGQIDELQSLSLAVARAENRAAQLADEQEIDRRRTYLQGHIEGALKIIASQLESILGPMSADDREMYFVAEEVYLQVLSDARAVNFWPIFDEDSLVEVSDMEGFDEARTIMLGEALVTGATPSQAHLALDGSESAFRVIALLGPVREPYGMLEVVLEDGITPLEEEVETLAASFEKSLAERTVNLEQEAQRKRHELAEQHAAAAQRALARRAEFEEVGENAAVVLAGVLAISTVLSAAVIGLLVVMVISRPIGRLLPVMVKLGEGETGQEIPDTARRDELGDIARALIVFKDNIRKKQELEAAQADQRAVSDRRAQQIQAVTRDFESGIGELVAALSDEAGEMKSSASVMLKTAEETARQTAAADEACRSGADSVDSVARAAEELTRSITRISAETDQASSASAQAREEAKLGNQRVRELSEAAERIGEVVKLISDIAEQTNLLALNATIEAARAGDAGKGFSVVAGEVKNLASQTAKATEEIERQIQDVQGATVEAVAAFQCIGETIAEVNKTTVSITAAMEKQASATETIAMGGQTASRDSQQVGQNVADVSASVDRTTTAADRLLKGAERLASHSDTLREEVDGFLAEMRSA